MKIILFLLLYLIQKISSEYETLDLTYDSGYYYIDLNFPNEKSSFIFSTKLPKCFFPSTACRKCRYGVIDYSNPNFQNSTKNISIPYYFYNFIGKEYNATISTDKYQSPQNFCSFDDLTYATAYSGFGRFSLSFLNYNFNTEKKIFAIKFTDDATQLHLGGYDNNVDLNKADNFSVVVEHSYENYTKQIIHKNTSSNSFYNSILYENNLLSETNDDNDTKIENITIEIDKSVWYMNFTNLKIKTDSEREVDYKLDKYKLTLDMSANKFYIPKEFFVKNVQKIFPKEAKCQLARDGYFICQCDEDYKTKFGSFVFENEKGTKFYVNVTDYMTFQSSVSGSECDVHLVINYDNDLFIGGTTVLNNYYSIFDIENQMINILSREDLNVKETSKFLIIFFVIVAATLIILFGGYYFYNKFVINEPTGLVPPNIQQNNNNVPS